MNQFDAWLHDCVDQFVESRTCCQSTQEMKTGQSRLEFRCTTQLDRLRLYLVQTGSVLPLHKLQRNIYQQMIHDESRMCGKSEETRRPLNAKQTRRSERD